MTSKAVDLLLERLVGDVEVFFADVWRRRFLYCPGAGHWLLRLAESIPSAAEVRRVLSGPAAAVDGGRRYLSFPPEGEVVARTWITGAAAGPVEDETMNLPQAEQIFPALAPIAAALRHRFAAPVNLQLFVSAAGAGLRPHRDIHDSFVVQLEGRKRWRIEDPQAASDDALQPRGNSGGHFGDGARTVVLKPGDMLYKPSHGVHATSSEDRESLSLTASLVTITAGQALLRWIEAATLFDPAWRIPLPASAADRVRLQAALAELPGLLPSVEALLAASTVRDDNDNDVDVDVDASEGERLP